MDRDSSVDVLTLRVADPSGRQPGPPSEARSSRYVTLEQVGRGGMGRVLRAYDPKLQREVALKEVHNDALDEESTARLVAEARAMAKLSHPNVVAVYDVGELVSGEVFLVMEYVAGQPLNRWLRMEDRGWRTIVETFVAAGRGLAAAHAEGLLHRDFKPANVLVSEAGAVKVTDFGIAKMAGTPSQGWSLEFEASSEDLTEAGTVMGTPRYMPPEQHEGEALSAAADQYAFCVALWEGLCGEPPFSGSKMHEEKLEGPPPWPKPGIPRTVVQAVLRGLAPQPEHRWPHMHALLEAVQLDPGRRRTKQTVVAGSVLVTLTGGGVGYEAWAQARAERCSGALQQLAGVWDDERRSLVDAAFSAVDRAYASAALAKTMASMDA